MTGPIAQIVAITVHGNAALTGRAISRFFLTNSTCRFCDEIAFDDSPPRRHARVSQGQAAATPDEWFANLRGNGARGLRLSYKPQNKPIISDRLSAGFVGGGGTWMIDAALAGLRSEQWVSDWKVWDQHAPEQRIWRVIYRVADRGERKNSPAHDLGQIKQRFLTHLRATRAFSRREKCDPFTERFDQAIDTLSGSTGTLHGCHRDLSPAGFLEPEAVRLLDAAQSSYVFGAMGSWNDLGFEGDARKEYERLSDALFDTVNDVIVTATNTSYPEPSH